MGFVAFVLSQAFSEELATLEGLIGLAGTTANGAVIAFIFRARATVKREESAAFRDVERLCADVTTSSETGNGSARLSRALA